MKLDFSYDLIKGDLAKFEQLFFSDIVEASGIETSRLSMVSVEPSVIGEAIIVSFDMENVGYTAARFKETMYAEDVVTMLLEQMQDSSSKLMGGTYTAYIDIAFGIRASTIPLDKNSGANGSIGTASAYGGGGIDMVLPINDRFIELESNAPPTRGVASRLRRFLGL